MSNLNNQPGLKEHDIKLSSIVIMIYCLVAAGAFGIEEMIPASGPGLTIVMLIVLPFIWAAPQALVCAELGSAIPEAGGFYKWVQRGLGEFWGFQACWCRTLSNYVDNTLYIVLAAGYIGSLIPMSEAQSFILKACFIGVFTFINLRGLKDISIVNTILSLVIFTAFALVTVVGFMNWNQSPMQPFIPPGESLLPSIGASLAIGMWMYSGYTSMSTLSAEVKDKSVIPKALIIVMPIIALSYILPTIAGLGSVGQWQDWTTDGGISFGNVLGYLGTWGLPAFLIVATLSNLALYNLQIISISRAFFALATDNLAPKVLVKLNKKHHVPYISVMSLALFNLVLCTFDFTILVTIDVILLMVDFILIWFAGIKLRINEPDMPRPFKIPVGTKGFICIVTPGIAIAVISLFLNGADYFLGGMIGLLSSPVMYVIWKKKYGGMYKLDAEKYPINLKTKLAPGDYGRMSIIFAIFAILGLLGTFIIFPWYEGAWAVEYYAETYGSENAFNIILWAIKIVSAIYGAIAILLKFAESKYDRIDAKI